MIKTQYMKVSENKNIKKKKTKKEREALGMVQNVLSYLQTKLGAEHTWTILKQNMSW